MSPTKHAIGAEKRELGVGDGASSPKNLGVQLGSLLICCCSGSSRVRV